MDRQKTKFTIFTLCKLPLGVVAGDGGYWLEIANHPSK